MVSVAGTVALLLSEAMATDRPAAGAALLIVTVATEVTPPPTVVGLRVSELNVGAVTLRAAVADWPLAEAPMFAVTSAATATVVTLNVAEVAPATTVTVAGTVAAALSEVRATAWPPVGAGPLIVTVATEVVPPATVVGLSDSPDATAGFTVRVAVAVPALIVTDLVAVAIGVVVTVKFAKLDPATIVIEAGTVTDASLDEVATVRPPVGAGPAMLTTAVEDVPPVTVVGLRVTPVTVGALTVKFAFTELPPTVAVMAPTTFAATGVVVIVKAFAV